MVLHIRIIIPLSLRPPIITQAGAMVKSNHGKSSRRKERNMRDDSPRESGDLTVPTAT